ncbi:uncharacterized protein LOC144587587 [Pogona vitticeps]
MARSESRHRWFAARVAVFFLSAGSIKPCCAGTEECSHTFHMSVPQGSSESVILPINTTGKILLLHGDFQECKGKRFRIGLPNHLNKHDNKTEVSLDNQNFTLQDAKKADEGLYRIREYFTQRCLAQVNVTVPDPSPSPSPDITNLHNANITITPPQFHPENSKAVINVPVVTYMIIIQAIAMILI